MIKFSDKEIEYLKGQVKEAYNMLNGSDEQKEIMEFVDDEDRALVNKFIKDETLWDKVNEDEKINKNILDVCWGTLGMATYWLLHGSFQYVLDITGDEQYAEIYKLIGGEEDW